VAVFFNKLSPKCGYTYFLFDLFFAQNETLAWKQSYLCWKCKWRDPGHHSMLNKAAKQVQREAIGLGMRMREGEN